MTGIQIIRVALPPAGTADVPDRVDGIQRPGLALRELMHHRVSGPADHGP